MAQAELHLACLHVSAWNDPGESAYPRYSKPIDDSDIEIEAKSTLVDHERGSAEPRPGAHLAAELPALQSTRPRAFAYQPDWPCLASVARARTSWNPTSIALLPR